MSKPTPGRTSKSTCIDVNISSHAAFRPRPLLDTLCTSKATLPQWTRCLALGTQAHGIAVFAFAPVLVRTVGSEYLVTAPEVPKELADIFRGRFSRGEDTPIARAVQMLLFLASDGIRRNDVDYILETFPIVKRKGEQAHGEYCTKRVILDVYDALQQAIETGTAYHTNLDSPPANGWTPPEITLETVIERQGDGAKEDTAANSLDDVQRRAESAVAQPTLHLEAPE